MHTHNSFFALGEPFELSTPVSPFPIHHNLDTFHNSSSSMDFPRQMTDRSITAGSNAYGHAKRLTAGPPSRPESRQRPRSDSTASGYAGPTNPNRNRHQDRNTWSGSAPPITQRTPSTLAAGRNHSQTNFHRSPSNSPTTPTTIQRSPSSQSIYAAPTISRRLSTSSQHPFKRRIIQFYHRHEPHYGFTNFSNHAVKYLGKIYPTSEHLFQSLKFAHRPLLAEHIRTCDDRPSMAFSEARRFQPEIRQDWGSYNIEAMELTIFHKFSQHRSLKEELLSTGDAELVENSDKDPFWGCGPDGKGRNELGRALERLRTRFRG